MGLTEPTEQVHVRQCCQPGHVLQQAERWPWEPVMGHSFCPALRGISWEEMPAPLSSPPSKHPFASLDAGTRRSYGYHRAATSPWEWGWSQCQSCERGHSTRVGWGCISCVWLHSKEIPQYRNTLTTAFYFHYCLIPPCPAGTAGSRRVLHPQHGRCVTKGDSRRRSLSPPS